MCSKARIISDNTPTYVQTKKYYKLISQSEKNSTSAAKILIKPNHKQTPLPPERKLQVLKKP
jgi:hypothetical protein